MYFKLNVSFTMYEYVLYMCVLVYSLVITKETGIGEKISTYR